MTKNIYETELQKFAIQLLENARKERSFFLVSITITDASRQTQMQKAQAWIAGSKVTSIY